MNNFTDDKIVSLSERRFKTESNTVTYDWESAEARNRPSGSVEDFCQVYTAEEAIIQFCGGMLNYQQSTDNGEAIYVHQDSKQYPWIFAISPDKQLCACPVDGALDYMNAFDIVLFLKYDILDEETDQNKIKNRRKSFLAFKADLKSDTAYQEYVKRKKLGTMGLDPDRDAWRLKLKLDSKGNFKNCLENYELIFENDDVFSALCYSEFLHAVVKTRPFDWESHPDIYTSFGEELNEMDIAQIKVKIAKEYGIANPSDKHISTAKMVVANKRPINPLKDFYSEIRGTWDGIERIQYLLQEYLGIEDNKYARFLSKAIMIGMVARSLATGDGVKFDIVPILHGPQGPGKTTFCSELMPPGYFKTIKRISGKDIALELGIGVCELSEARVLKRSSVTEVKGFLTETFDKHRYIYERNPTKLVRKCIFMVTTNELDGLLKDETGNRRFYPVMCAKKYRTGDITDDIRSQLFAEALVYYDQGDFNKYLFTEDEEIEAYANSLRENFEDNGELKAAIEEYIEKNGTTTLCVKELYIKVLKQPEERYLVDKTHQSLLYSILNNLEGWQRDKPRTIYKDFGKQTVYRKIL